MSRRRRATVRAMAKRTLGSLAATVAVCAALAGTIARPAVAQGGNDDPEAARARAVARDTLAAMETASAHARLVLRRARASHDARVVACADEALTRADVAVRIGKDHAERASAAWSQGDRDRARFETARLVVRGDLARAAARDADACVAGVPAPVAAFAPNDVTIVHLVVDPTLPRDVAGYP